MTMENLRLALSDLRLDEQNPRLPEELQGKSQEALLEYMYENAVLDELARSFVDNGFFEHEPLLVVDGDASDHRHVVLEGNRRLAALKILLQDGDAEDAGLAFDLDVPLTRQRRTDLASIPCFNVGSREEVKKYLGFRHIGGIKTWSAEAKARYLYDETETAHRDRAANPFLEVARRVGSNTQGVRNSYIAISILRYATSEFSLDVQHVQHHRFGVWLRCMNSADLRGYIGFNGARSYEEVKTSLPGLRKPALNEVIGDLTPQGNRQKPLLNDSRDVTIYARVLTNERAHEALREYEQLAVARQIIEEAELPLRVLRLRDSVRLALEEVQRAEVTDALMNAAEELFIAARSLRDILRGRVGAVD